MKNTQPIIECDTHGIQLVQRNPAREIYCPACAMKATKDARGKSLLWTQWSNVLNQLKRYPITSIASRERDMTAALIAKQPRRQ